MKFSIDAKEFWADAYTLASACTNLADPMIAVEERRKIRELKDKPSLAVSHIPNIEKLETTEFGKVVSEFAKAMKPITMQNEARWAKEKDILRQLLSGKLVGIGYGLPRKSVDDPEYVPVDIWAGEVDWKKEMVSGNGLEFVSVRIVPFEYMKSVEEDHLNVEREIIPQRGRPTVKPMVIEAFEELKSIEKIDFEMPMTVCFPQIREWLINKYPKDSARLGNLANETIRGIISDLYKQVNTSNKQ